MTCSIRAQQPFSIKEEYLQIRFRKRSGKAERLWSLSQQRERHPGRIRVLTGDTCMHTMMSNAYYTLHPLYLPLRNCANYSTYLLNSDNSTHLLNSSTVYKPYHPCWCCAVAIVLTGTRISLRYPNRLTKNLSIHLPYSYRSKI
jgi:hypothetical protein